MDRDPATPHDAGARPLQLSAAADAALDREVDAVLSYEAEHGGATGATWRPRRIPQRRHWRLTTAAVDARFVVVPVVLMLLITMLIATVGDTYALAGVAFLAMVVGVTIVAEVIAAMTREVEHVSPETAALLEDDGIADPDRLFGDRLAARRPAPTSPA